MRLEDSGLIEKKVDGTYTLTTFGQTVCTQIPSIVFISQNKKYFQEHDFVKFLTNFRCVADN